MTEKALKRIRALAANDEGISAEGTRQLLAGYDALQARVERLELCNRELQTLIDNEGYPSGVDYDAACAERDSLRLQLNSLRTSYDFLANIRSQPHAEDKA